MDPLLFVVRNLQPLNYFLYAPLMMISEKNCRAASPATFEPHAANLVVKYPKETDCSTLMCTSNI